MDSKSTLVRVQKEVMGKVKNTSSILENSYIMNRMLVVNKNIKGDFARTSDGNEEYVIGQWRKSDPCYEVAENLAELCSAFG